ncbi:MAG: D-alanyl-D-alanine carboxypeptidase/D-alanyl-D-alanine-endopeptidase [Amaricoccus sp.]
MGRGFTGAGIGRRAVLAGGAALLAAPALRMARAAEPDSLDAILAAPGLAGRTGFALVDLATGQTVEARGADVGRPPASVAKIVTTLYALDALGPDYRFRTSVRGDGAVEGGQLAGDLVLAGGGDPVFDTDAMAGLAAALRERGLAGVGGRLLVADGALPAVAEIDAGQPAEAAYNPAIAGINLNFNRVFLAWKAGGGGLAFSAPDADGGGVAMPDFGAELGDGAPAHRLEAGREIWTLPKGGLQRQGSIWLPVRAPAAYSGAAFAALAGGAGLKLPGPEVVAAAPDAGVLAVHDSPPLAPVLREMLLYSTNLTAEVVGLRASQARGLAPDGLAASGAAMTAWARNRFGVRDAVLVNHSGLSDATRITPSDLVAVLQQAEALGLPELLKPRPILDPSRQPAIDPGASVVCKTGTLDFVSALAGYLTGKRRRLAFAILAADPQRRAAIPPELRADPPGGKAWTARARGQEQALLRRWAALYA